MEGEETKESEKCFELRGDQTLIVSAELFNLLRWGNYCIALDHFL